MTLLQPWVAPAGCGVIAWSMVGNVYTGYVYTTHHGGCTAQRGMQQQQ